MAAIRRSEAPNRLGRRAGPAGLLGGTVLTVLLGRERVFGGLVNTIGPENPENSVIRVFAREQSRQGMRCDYVTNLNPTAAK